MLKTNFLLFLAIGGLFSLTRVDYTAAAPTKNAANAGSKMLLPTESFQLTHTATNQNLLPMASGTVNNKNLLPTASSHIADTAKKQSLLPTESVQLADNLKNLDLLPMESVQIADKLMNQSLLQMESGQLANQNLLSLASSQIGQIVDNQMKNLDTYKNQSLFPMEKLQVAESSKSHRLFPIENVPQLAIPSEVNHVTHNAMKSLDATNDDLQIFGTRLLPLGYKLKASDLRAIPSQPLFNYKRTSEARMPQYDRFETQKARIDYYRPLSSYREKYYMKKDGRDSDFQIPYLNSNDSVPRELVQNFDNLLAESGDKEEPDKEITIPLPESAHNATEVQMRVQARARQNYYPGGKLANVCLGRSTVYNKPRVMNWLEKKVYMYYSTDDHSNDVRISLAQEVNRPMYFDLRLELFKNGKSEECHVPSLDKWRQYLECALRRNQRMEYMIPMYPLHQIGYKYHWSRSMDERGYNNYRSYVPRTDFGKMWWYTPYPGWQQS
ncbi:uncharacterized protein Dvir_GJ26671 [Drosophila virilis]|uniref:Uncharacterized protein n=1 Tax=Drosophila virilis TaxID=7244 RepID=A0A0Q9W839_DROVI|nr:uncharacterized protein LOC26531441 [Drosophila virilis]KRF78049.1 uncharacterized protein Dvir_GJ26671 [Drosophila virilis]